MDVNKYANMVLFLSKERDRKLARMKVLNESFKGKGDKLPEKEKEEFFELHKQIEEIDSFLPAKV